MSLLVPWPNPLVLWDGVNVIVAEHIQTSWESEEHSQLLPHSWHSAGSPPPFHAGHLLSLPAAVRAASNAFPGWDEDRLSRQVFVHFHEETVECKGDCCKANRFSGLV